MTPGANGSAQFSTIVKMIHFMLLYSGSTIFLLGITAKLAQPAARRSHNPEVMSSILILRTFSFFFRVPTLLVRRIKAEIPPVHCLIVQECVTTTCHFSHLISCGTLLSSGLHSFLALPWDIRRC